MAWIHYVLLTLALIILGSCSSEQFLPASTPAPASSPKMKRPPLPVRCRPLLAAPDPSTWDPVKEEYEVGDQWINCMGVGKKTRALMKRNDI